MTLDLDAIRTRYQDGYHPNCGGCGQIMVAVTYGHYRCQGRVKVGGRWQECPAQEQWDRPSEQARHDVRALLDLVAAAKEVADAAAAFRSADINRMAHLRGCVMPDPTDAWVVARDEFRRTAEAWMERKT